MLPDGSYVKVKPEEGKPPVDSQMAMYGYFQHGWDSPAKPAAPVRKPAAAAASPARENAVSKKEEPASSARFRGIFGALFGRSKK